MSDQVNDTRAASPRPAPGASGATAGSKEEEPRAHHGGRPGRGFGTWPATNPNAVTFVTHRHWVTDDEEPEE